MPNNPIESNLVRTDVYRISRGSTYDRLHGLRRLAWAMGAIVLLWAWLGSDMSLAKLVQGAPHALDFVKRMFPPDYTDGVIYLRAAGETLQIAVVGTCLATILAFPLSFLAARNIHASRPVYLLTRLFFDLCRGVSELIWGLLLVAAVGLGPLAGVLALTIHEVGALGRYFSELIENVHSEVLEAPRSAGASALQTITRSIVPEVKPYIATYVFYYFEHSIRSATVLGFVGAGGIGLILETRMKLFQFQKVTAVLSIILAMVVISDWISAVIRRQMIGKHHFQS
jgi:phosphonate transport system permease protein